MVPLDEGSRRAQESDMYEEVQRMEVDPRATSMSYREDPSCSARCTRPTTRA